MHSDFELMKSIMHNAQGLSMIAIKGIFETEMCITTHLLFVRINSNQVIKYTFVCGNGNDYLYSVKILNQSFEDTIMGAWKIIQRDGRCCMTVHTI